MTMPFTPDDPRRHEPDQLALLQVAHIRIYQYSLECCAHLRAIIEAAGTDDVEHLKQFAHKVDLSVIQLEPSHELSLGIDIEIDQKTKSTDNPDGEIIETGRTWMALDPRRARDVLRRVQRHMREAIAAYMLPSTHEQMAHSLESEGRYDELERLDERFAELRERIVEGDLPVPPPKMHFPAHGSI